MGLAMFPRVVEITGWMSEHELSWLYHTAMKVPQNQLIVEVGAWMGRSTAALYLGADGQKPVVTIDTWQGSPEEESHDIARTEDILDIFKKNMERVGIPIEPFTSWDKLENKCYYLVGDSLDLIPTIPDESITLCFYDGNHHRTGENIDLLLPKMRTDGLLTGHDYFRFYEYIQQEIHKRFWIYQVQGDIWIKYMSDPALDWYED